MALIVAEPSTTICVGNLPRSMTSRELRLTFKFANNVERCVVNHTKDGRQVGYARFATAEDAQNAADYLNGYPLDEDFPKPAKVFMSATQLRDPLPGMSKKRSASAAFGGGGARKYAKKNFGGKGRGKGMNATAFKMAKMAMGMPMGFGMQMGMNPMAYNMGLAMAQGMGMKKGKGFGKQFGGKQFGGKQFGKGKGKGRGAGSNAASVYVGGIPREWDQTVLQSMFENFGKINKISLSRGNNPNGNIAFIHYASKPEAQAAIQVMNRHMLDGTRYLTVRRNTSPGAKY